MTDNNNRKIFFLDVVENGLSFFKDKSTNKNINDSFNSNYVPNLDLTRVLNKKPSISADAKKRILIELEEKLLKLSEKGVLRDVEICFGRHEDPFHLFAGKFDISIKVLELFKTYVPGKLYFQTRSPLVVLALPVFKKLEGRVSVTIPIETMLESASERYTPNYPKIEERFKASLALKRFGVPTTIQVAPLLPYGNILKDTKEFAELLDEHSNYISLGSFSINNYSKRNLVEHEIVKKLTFDRKLEFLNKRALSVLSDELEYTCPEKLILPKFESSANRQMSIFAA